MVNSRKEGILVLNTEHTFPVSINGQFIDKQKIICKDIDYKTEYVAYDLEQAIQSALFGIAKQANGETPDGDFEKQQADNQLFYKNESPTEEDVREQAEGLQLIVGMSQSVSISDIMRKFLAVVEGKRLFVEGNIPLTIPIWQKIHRDDKLKIAFSYICFFANPLPKLQNSRTVESKGNI